MRRSPCNGCRSLPQRPQKRASSGMGFPQFGQYLMIILFFVNLLLLILLALAYSIRFCIYKIKNKSSPTSLIVWILYEMCHLSYVLSLATVKCPSLRLPSGLVGCWRTGHGDHRPT